MTANLPKGFQNKWGEPLFLKKELLRIIEKNFVKFGYSPLETSPMQLSSIIGNTLSEDEENPMSDVYTFSDDGMDVSLRYDLSQGFLNFYKKNYMNLPNPVKRYEIGTVFREKNQVAVDINLLINVMSMLLVILKLNKLMQDLCSIIGSIFEEFLKNSEFVINISNRKNCPRLNGSTENC